MATQESDAVMSSQRHTGAFIIGGVLGGLAGAAVTLWNTPKSGAELRAAVSGGQQGSAELGSDTSFTAQRKERFSNPVLGFIEKATAPIVGVELGKQAKDDPEAAQSAPVRTSAADAQAPVMFASEEERPAASAEEGPYPGDKPVPPEDKDTHDDDDGSSAHAASTEDLTTPSPDYAEKLKDKPGSNITDDPDDTPDLSSGGRG